MRAVYFRLAWADTLGDISWFQFTLRSVTGMWWLSPVAVISQLCAVRHLEKSAVSLSPGSRLAWAASQEKRFNDW